MDVIRSKIKLINRKNGAVEVFLSGMTVETGQGLEQILSKYMDTESGYSIIREQYIAVVDAPKKTQGGK